MSSHPQKNQKMCKSPSKSMPYQKADAQKSPKALSEIGSYEQLSTNCTMVGSNNLNLDSKINYITPQIKVCAKPMKAQEVKKSPRSLETYIHNQIITNTKFQSANTFNHVRPQVATSYSKFDSFQTQRLPVNKSPVSFPNVQTNTNVNNGGNVCNMSPSAYSNPSPSYPSNAVSPYNVQNSSPANSISSISSGVAGIKSPVASPQNIRPPTPQPILPQVRNSKLISNINITLIFVYR